MFLIVRLAYKFDVLPCLKAKDSWFKRQKPAVAGLTLTRLDGRSSRPLLFISNAQCFRQYVARSVDIAIMFRTTHSADISNDAPSDLSCH